MITPPFSEISRLPVHHHHSFLPEDTLKMRKSKPQNSLLLVMIANVTAHIDRLNGKF